MQQQLLLHMQLLKGTAWLSSMRAVKRGPDRLCRYNGIRWCRQRAHTAYPAKSIRTWPQELDLLTGPAQSQAPSGWDKDELVGQLSDLCEALLAESFRWEDVQTALQVQPQMSVI